LNTALQLITTDYLASETFMTLKINDKEPTSNTQSASNDLDDSAPIVKKTLKLVVQVRLYLFSRNGDGKSSICGVRFPI